MAIECEQHHNQKKMSKNELKQTQTIMPFTETPSLIPSKIQRSHCRTKSAVLPSAHKSSIGGIKL